jgi:hypothetical protein
MDMNVRVVRKGNLDDGPVRSNSLHCCLLH